MINRAVATYSPKEVIFGGTAADYGQVVQFVTARLEASAEYPEAALFDFDACSAGNYRDLEEG